MNKTRKKSKSEPPGENYQHQSQRRESNAMDLLVKLTQNKRNSIGSPTGSDKFSASSSFDKQHHHDGDLEPPLTEDWYEELSDDHSSAFKEVFDMLDSAQTGILNADTLYDGLKRVDSDITREEVENILKILDKDGNGEIDFDEFLMHITSIGSADEEPGDEGGTSESSRFTKRQRLFFSALKKFNIKSDLCKLQAKKVEQPHVLSHYTAGVRLIGLTDKQLTIKLKRMQRAARSINSPYAKPLNFVIQSGDSKVQTVRKTIGLKKSHVLLEMDKPAVKLFLDPLRVGARKQEEVEREIQAFVTETIKAEESRMGLFKKMPKIKEIISLKKPDFLGLMPEPIGDSKTSKSQIKTFSKSKSDTKCMNKDTTTPPKTKSPTVYRKRGWVIPRTERAKIPLPVVKLNGKQLRLTVEDLPDIREKVKTVVDMYYSNLRKAFVRTAWEHWEKLYSHRISSKKLLNHFREVYRAYSPHKEEEAFVVCPWVPGPFRSVHNKRIHTAGDLDRSRSPELKSHYQNRPFSAMY